MSVATGKVHYLLEIGRELTPEQVSGLAEECGVPASQIRSLTLVDARRLAAAPDGQRASVVRQVLGEQAGATPPQTSWPLRVLGWLVAWLRSFVRRLKSALGRRGMRSAPSRRSPPVDS